MILGFTGCWVTARDYLLCKRILEQLEAAGSPLGAVLRDRLENASVVEPEKLAANVVTLDSRVEFSMDGGAPEQRTLVHDAGHHAIGLHLPLATARGIGMLGLRAGQHSIISESRRQRKLHVHRVLFQPLPRQEFGANAGAASAVIDFAAAKARASARNDGVQLPSDTIQTREIR